MDAPAAALIGAGVGSIVSLASQFLAHRLALNQDRRNARRTRLADAITEAGSTLYEIPQPEPLSEEEFDAWKAALPSGSLAAENPERHYDLGPFNDAASRAMWTLDLYLDDEDDWLKEGYLDAVVKCALAEEAKSRHFRSKDIDWRIANIPVLDKVMTEARETRSEWMRLARQHVDRI